VNVEICGLTFELRGSPAVWRTGQQAQNGPQALRLMASVPCRWASPLNEGLGVAGRDCMVVLPNTSKPDLDVVGNCAMGDNLWPKHDSRSGQNFSPQTDDAKIVVQVLAKATVVCEAGSANTRCTFSPLAGSSDVLTFGIGQEDVGAAVSTLSSPFESSPSGGQRLKVGVICDGDQQVHVFWSDLVGRQGSNEGDSQHPRESGC
jgi:hypothetical protein